MHEGQAVRIAGEGEPGESGGPAGDLHCYIAIKPHPMFSRHNNDLVCQVPDQRSRRRRSAARSKCRRSRARRSWTSPPARSTARSSSSRARACPTCARYRTGDELVQILIEIPKKLTDRQKQLLREFAASAAVRRPLGFKGTPV